MNITHSETPAAATRSIAAFFATRPAAEKAKAEVVGAGVSSEAVKISDARGTITGNAAATPREGTGIIDTIKHAFLQDQPSDDDQRHERGFVVTAHVASQVYDDVRGLLGKEGRITGI